MDLRDLLEKLYALLAEELELSGRDDPSLPVVKIGCKLVRRSYLSKDGARKQYQYRYKYYAYAGKQKYLNRKDAQTVTHVLAVRARLHMVREALCAVVSALNHLLPEAENGR